jgi:hypothetical protein
MKEIFLTLVQMVAAYFTPPSRSRELASVPRVTPEEVQRKLESGDVLLVCAYEAEAMFRTVAVEGAISFKDFQVRLPALSKAQEVVFYCA